MCFEEVSTLLTLAIVGALGTSSYSYLIGDGEECSLTSIISSISSGSSPCSDFDLTTWEFQIDNYHYEKF